MMNCSGKNCPRHKPNKAGSSFRAARSPVAPKMTMVQGSGCATPGMYRDPWEVRSASDRTTVSTDIFTSPLTARDLGNLTEPHLTAANRRRIQSLHIKNALFDGRPRQQPGRPIVDEPAGLSRCR